jgi:hypothetical protein
MSGTDLSLFVDVDIVPCRALAALLFAAPPPESASDAQGAGSRGGRGLQAVLREGCIRRRAVFVVPTFEFHSGASGGAEEAEEAGDGVGVGEGGEKNVESVNEEGRKEEHREGVRFTPEEDSDLPIDIAALHDAYRRGEATPFQGLSFPPGHAATNFQRWTSTAFASLMAGIGEEAGEEASAGLAGRRGTGTGAALPPTTPPITPNAWYAVNFTARFEPFLIASTEAVVCDVCFDERFCGYGYNKIVHTTQLHMAGYAFHVLHHVFLVSRTHARSRWWHRVYGPSATAADRATVKELYRRRCRELGVLYPDVPLPT